jgi:hypothetical protein
MKEFRVCNLDLNNWKEFKMHHAYQVVDAIKNWDEFEIEWKTPVTGEYHTLVKKENGVLEIDEVFKIPKCILKAVRR